MISFPETECITRPGFYAFYGTPLSREIPIYVLSITDHLMIWKGLASLAGLDLSPRVPRSWIIGGDPLGVPRCRLIAIR